MGIIKFIKQWTLLCAIVFGSIVYLVFTHIAVLTPFGDYIGPKLVTLLPVNIFLMLYITFCKIQMNDLTPRKWHFILQGIRTLLAALSVVAANLCTDPTYKLIWEGVFICVICPTAAAAPVIVDKLGGSIASLTVYLLIANCFTSIIIPLFFPLMEKGADITFAMAAWMVLKRVLTVLVIPLGLVLAKVPPQFRCVAENKAQHSFLSLEFQPFYHHGTCHAEHHECPRFGLGARNFVHHSASVGHLPVLYGQTCRLPLWRQHWCWTGLGTEKHGGWNMAHALVSQSLCSHCPLCLRDLAEHHQRSSAVV